MQIDSAVLDVLGNCELIGNSLKLPAQLDRKLYVNVNKIIELAGGKWNRKAQAHLFESDAAELMDQIVLTGEITDKKSELGYFPTPSAVVALLMEYAEIEPGMLVLEPSAGQGAIAVEMVRKGATVHCVEIDPENNKHLFGKLHLAGENWVTTLGDFLLLPPQNIPYDRVVMNPPFGKNAAPKHVLRALSFLAPGGVLVAVMPSSVCFRTDKLNTEVRNAAAMISPLPEGSFASSGTNVNTVIVVIRK